MVTNGRYSKCMRKIDVCTHEIQNYKFCLGISGEGAARLTAGANSGWRTAVVGEKLKRRKGKEEQRGNIGRERSRKCMPRKGTHVQGHGELCGESSSLYSYT